jgi:hypothetical protein
MANKMTREGVAKLLHDIPFFVTVAAFDDLSGTWIKFTRDPDGSGFWLSDNSKEERREDEEVIACLSHPDITTIAISFEE